MIDNAVPAERTRLGHAGNGKNAAKIFAFMTLTGPFFGALPYLSVLVYAVVKAAMMEPEPGAAGELASTIFGVGAMAVVFGYAFGGLSAAICAAVVAATVYRIGKIGFWATVAIGVASSLMGGALLQWVVSHNSGAGNFGFGASLIVPGAAAAAICWLIMRKLGWVQTIETPTFTED